MPKRDLLPVINQRTGGAGLAHGAVVVVQAATGTPATDPNDAIRPRGHFGVQYFGPTVYLAEDLSVDAVEMVVTANIFNGDETVYISSISGYEKCYLLGPGIVRGQWWSFPISRGEGYSDPLTHPAYAEVISTGSPGTGGFILIDSARDVNSPFMAMYQNEVDRSETWRLQLGRLASVPDWFKDYFEDVDAEDWDDFSLAADNIFLSGFIRATGGLITGNLKVTGTIFVPYDDGKPMLEFGKTIDGHGMVMRDDQGAPRFVMVRPYVDEDGNESPLAMVLAHRGKKGLYWHYDAAVEDYVLELPNATAGPLVMTPDTATFAEGKEVWDDIRIPVTSTRVGGASNPDWVQMKDNGAASVGVFTYHFDKNTAEHLYFSLQMPHNWKLDSDIHPHVHWCPTDTDTGSVVWGIEFTWANIDGTYGNTTIITTTDAADGTAYKHQMAEFDLIDGWSFTASSMIICRVFRDAGDGSDDYDADAALLEVDFHYQIDRFGDPLHEG